MTQLAKILPFSKLLWRSRRSVLAILMVMMLSPILLFTMDRAKDIIQDLSDTNKLLRRQLEEEVYHVGTGCNMPILDPFADQFANFNRNLPILKCRGVDWVNCFKSDCRVSQSILRTTKDVICMYRYIIYVSDENSYVSNPIKVVGDEKFTLNRSDHVKIECTGKHINNPKVKTHWTGFKAGFRQLSTVPVPPNRKDSYNVMILCFDSTSRNGFIRNMQKSYKYLTEQLNAVILNSYNIVADGTTGALYPILSGKPEEEHIFSRYRWETARKKYIGPMKFIFHMLKKYGYRTAYFEDMPWSGSTQQKFTWFRKQPADHYLRTTVLNELDRDREEKTHRGHPTRHCFGPTPQYQFMMNLADQFLKLDGKKFCFTLIVDTAYDNFTVHPTADDSLVSFLKTLEDRGALEDTLVMVMGDHGSRYSKLRNTYQGRMEERLPLMAILLPEKLKKLRPDAFEALKQNQDVLTTPFDIHATILDVLDLKNKIDKDKIPGTNLPRVMTLLEPIPKSRSCGEAGVMPHWCACSEWHNVARNDPKFAHVGTVFSEYVQSMTQEVGEQCAIRRLSSTEWVLHQRAVDHLSRVNYIDSKDLRNNNPFMKTLDDYYQARIIMYPGKAVFEGTLVYNSAGDYYMITYRDLSRVNAYGDESKCISATHPHLKKYCYCKHMLPNSYTFRNETFGK
nr:uncharacterized protein LOC110377994 [Helicoverpa armigera]